MAGARRDVRRRLFALAANQAGYFTAAQAREIGYSYQAQAHHVGADNWIRVDRGLFRLADWVPDLHDELARWSLWSKDQAVTSHESALSVHGIGELETRRVQLTAPPGFSMTDDAVTLHYVHLPDSDVMQRIGFRVTTPIRSIVDVAAHTPDEDQLARAIEEANRMGLLTLRRLTARAEVVDPTAALYIERAIRQIEPRPDRRR